MQSRERERAGLLRTGFDATGNRSLYGRGSVRSGLPYVALEERQWELEPARASSVLGFDNLSNLARQVLNRERLLKKGDLGIQKSVMNDGTVGVT
jgi:hypothetical protein